MRWIVAGGAVALAVIGTAGVARADEQGDMRKLVQDEIKAWADKKKEADAKDNVMRVVWKDGPVLESADKQYTLKFSMRMHLDSSFTDADAAFEGPPPGGLGEEFQDQTYFRRLRFGIGGDLTKYVDYQLVIDFADPSDAQLKDAYITIKNLKECIGCWAPSIRVGQSYEQIGLETLTSDNFTSFVERAGINALHPERSIGVNFFDSFWNEHAQASLGLYTPDGDDEDNGFGVWDEREGDGGYAVTGRFTLIPWAKDTCHFLHVGASASYRETDSVRFRARPGIGKGPRVLDTDTISDPESLWLLNAELGFLWHRFHASAEYTMLEVSKASIGDPTFSGWYVAAGYFLTGEARRYNFKNGVWASTRPCCNFLSNNCCCWGALELAARYDVLDLNDGTIRGGELSTLTVGLNWYLNPYARLMFDFVTSTAQDRAGGSPVVVIDDEDVNSFLMRFDVHF
jgi:phosphate-selective porin OprO and OprP